MCLNHVVASVYRFRVQVRTTEGVGVWSEPKEATRAEPGESIASSKGTPVLSPDIATKSANRKHRKWGWEWGQV